eukprot:COSAG05_NODE_19048_length_298_cov_1.457286_1_plen_20_part_10
MHGSMARYKEGRKEAPKCTN